MTGPIGAIDEATQSVQVAVSSSSPQLTGDPTVGGSGSIRSLSFQPLTDANGTATFTITADDGSAVNNVSIQSFTVTVNVVNDAPVATAGAAPTAEDTSISITLTGSDVENDPLTFTVGTAPANGVLTGVAPDLTYTPNADFFGADSFTFTASDGDLTSGEATIAIDVTGVNDAPVATAGVAATSEDTSASITLTGSDVENDPLTFTVGTAPANGVLTGVAPDLTYTPNADFFGVDSFTFTASDEDLTNGEATIAIRRDWRERCAGGHRWRGGDVRRYVGVDHTYRKRRRERPAYLYRSGPLRQTVCSRESPLT